MSKVCDTVTRMLQQRQVVLTCAPVEFTREIMPDFLERAKADGPYTEIPCPACGKMMYLGRRGQDLVKEAVPVTLLCMRCVAMSPIGDQEITPLSGME